MFTKCGNLFPLWDFPSWICSRFPWKTGRNIRCSSSEHLEEPSDLLSVLGGALAPDGVILAVLPINELRSNPHHLQVPTKQKIYNWVAASGLEVSVYFEADHIGWPIQPIIASDRGILHLCARIVSLAPGVPLSIAGLGGWRGLDAFLRRLRLPPSQACAVVKKS